MTGPIDGRARPDGDQAMEQVVGHLLRVGVLVSAAIAAIGGAVVLAQHGLARADYHVFAKEPPGLTTIGGILSGAARREGPALVQLGVLLLIATPIARVVLSLVAFLRQRDRLYVGVTAIVLAILLWSLLFGGHP